MGSEIENRFISELNLPNNCLLVSIYRGNAEILPRGNIKLLAGDLLLVMVNSSESGEMFEFLSKISSNE